MKTCKRILVVDDDEAIRESVRDLLELENYQVDVAVDGLEALDLLINRECSELPGMIILDMMMPRLDGIGFLQKIHEEYRDRFCKIPIVISSANADLSSAAIRNFSEVSTMRKPFDAETLFQLAKEHCGDPLTES